MSAAGIVSLIPIVLTLALCAMVVRAGTPAFQELADHFRGGGPKPPGHPLPADDARILNRRHNRPSN